MNSGTETKNLSTFKVGWGVVCLVLACFGILTYFSAGLFHASPLLVFLKPLPALAAALYLSAIAYGHYSRGFFDESASGNMRFCLFLLASITYIIYGIGDILLCFRTDKTWVPLAFGMAFFFVGHSCVVACCFVTNNIINHGKEAENERQPLVHQGCQKPSGHRIGATCLSVAECLAIIGIIIFMHERNKSFSLWMLASGTAYLMVYCVVTYCAILYLPSRRATTCICVGAAIYLASDLIIGFCLVLGAFPFAGAAIMSTYWVALSLFFAGINISLKIVCPTKNNAPDSSSSTPMHNAV